MKRPRVYVTDTFHRKSVAAIRGLAKAGMAVVVGESTCLSPGHWSRHVIGRYIYPSPRRAPEHFLSVLSEQLEQSRCDVLLPMEEDVLMLVRENANRLPARVKVPFATAERIRSVGDKANVMRQALDLGIPVPQTWFAGETVDDPREVVRKPRWGSGGRGQSGHLNGRTLGPVTEDTLVQERLPWKGQGAGVSVLLSATGECLALFSHVRLREYPVRAGSSTLRESTCLPVLEEASIRLLRSLDWSGVAMVEWKRDTRDGTWKLLEINPRFWGSLHLAIESGVNFPALVVQYAMGTLQAICPPYRSGVRARWLLPGDLAHYITNPDRQNLDPRFLSRLPHESCDILSVKDPGPTFGFFASFWPLVFDPDFRRFVRHTP